MYEKPTAIDLFCGAGGITQALKEAGFKVLCGIEYDNEVLINYKLNHMSNVINKDIRNVVREDLIHFCNIEPGELTLLAGCPPCQGFSRQNKKRHNEDPRNLLLLEYSRMVRILKPKYIFLENVPGIIRSELFQQFLDIIEIRKRRNKSRYFLHYKVVSAADYGVPQKRDRFVLVGKRSDLVNDKIEVDKIFASPTHISPNNWRADCGFKKWNTVGEFIGDLVEISAGETCKNDEVHRAAKLSDLNLTRLRHTPHNGGSRSDWPPELWLECHKKSGVSYSDVYGRMSYEDVAPTLTGGCCSISKGRFAHPVQDRAISLREAALIQTFPKDYKFQGPIQKIALQIGNAVPVKMGKEFFINIKEDWLKKVK